MAKAEWSNLLLLFRLGRSSEIANEELVVGKADLVNLWRLVEGNDSGPASIKMMYEVQFVSCVSKFSRPHFELTV